MKKIGIIMLCIVCVLVGPIADSMAQSVDDLIFMTEEYPPNNFKADGKLQGIFVDVVEVLMKKVKSKLTRKDIQILPWPNAFKRLQKKKNTALFSMAKTPEREALFKFVGPVTSIREVLIAKKDAAIKINSPEDINTYTVGVIRNDIGEKNTLQAGVDPKRIMHVPKIKSIIKMLDTGRIDLWPYPERTAFWILRENGYAPEMFETVYVFNEARDYYIAFNKDISDVIIRQFQAALDEMRQPAADGSKSAIEMIVDLY